MKARTTILLATMVACVLTFAACGSDDSGSDASSDKPSATLEDKSDPNLDPVKVGLIVAVGTPFSAVPSAVSTLEAAVRGVNARGGLNGHRVEMVFCNDKADPNEAVRCARQMVEENVIATAGGASQGDAQVQPILAEAGIPMIGFNAFTPTLWSATNMYYPQIIGAISYRAVIGYAVKNDLLPMAIAVADNPSGLQYGDALDEYLKGLNDGEGFTESVPVAADTADYAPIAAALGQSDARSVLLVISAPLQQGLMRAMESQGADIAAYLSAPSSSIQEVLDRGSLADRMIFAQTFPGFSDPSMERFREELAVQEASGDDNAKLDAITPLGTDPWFAMQAIESVTKDLDTIDAQSVSSALDSASDIDFGGAIAPWTPLAPGPEGMDRISNTCPWFVGVEDDKFTPVSDGPVCVDDIESGNFDASLPTAVEDAL